MNEDVWVATCECGGVPAAYLHDEGEDLATEIGAWVLAGLTPKKVPGPIYFVRCAPTCTAVRAWPQCWLDR